MTRITTTDRNAWNQTSAEDRARLLRDMPLEPMDEPKGDWVEGARIVALALAGMTLLYIACLWAMGGFS